MFLLSKSDLVVESFSSTTIQHNNSTVNSIQLKHQFNCNVLSFCFLGLDNHFRSSCLHRWVLSSPWAPLIVLIRCAEWWRLTLCGRWYIEPHGRLSCFISVSHSLHAAPLCLPLTGGYASVCTIPVQFHSQLILCCWWCPHACVFLFIFLKDTPCTIKSFVWLWQNFSCGTKPNKSRHIATVSLLEHFYKVCLLKACF